jgi:SAM-dependent methyltransferase
VNAQRLAQAEASLQTMLGVENLAGKTLVDVGCGSGLFSLAAMRLQAARVHSFDYDLESVACARVLKDRFFPDAERWTIEQGSALDPAYVGALGKWDVVYSWGVLHHTGRMWEGLGNAARLVAPGGVLFVSVYNDQGWLSRWWTRVKAFYNRVHCSELPSSPSSSPILRSAASSGTSSGCAIPVAATPSMRGPAACPPCTTGSTGSAAIRLKSRLPRRSCASWFHWGSS